MTENHFTFFLGLFILSYLFAKVEVQIEGPDGWAAKIPTWRIDNRWTRIFFGMKPLTGYHFYLLLFMAVIIHLPYIVGVAAPTRSTECRLVSFYILFWIIEDFLWFVVNPAFGIAKFKKEYIWWHSKTWLWIMPREYVVFGPLGIFLYYISL